ncbi:hypothetical protein BGX24_011610 [Mortierella sp. AD032]|nr:hypothetical protein BGX24_011610 [Mortierella sp. AD032]
MVWRTPASPQDTFTLQLVLAVNHPTNWKVCPHRQVYGFRTQEQLVSDGTNLDDPIYGTGSEFMAGIAQLPLIFGNANDVVQQKIIMYIGNDLNNSRTGAYFKGDIVRYVCTEWIADTHRSTVQLWRALLAHPAVRWIPRHDMDRQSNPLLDLLVKTTRNAEAFELVEVFIDYCVHRAKLEKDPLFLLPILQCLQELADPKKSYFEGTLMLLRDVAYLPARDREAIMSQHWIAHPFELHWRFWKPNPGGLDQYKDQVLKVTSARTVNRPENTLYSKVECHPFELPALDNPAIAALVEYKW